MGLTLNQREMKVLGTFVEDTTGYQVVSARYRHHLEKVVYGLAAAVPACTLFALHLYQLKINPEGSLTGHPGVDAIFLGAPSVIVGGVGLWESGINYLKARSTERDLVRLERASTIGADILADMLDDAKEESRSSVESSVER